ncbi:MAG: glycoside hydrolase family 97 protein [Bacteroidales bacterium]|nr:glycoside hydrolase family 97 protein [Bacteroidales bacterium]
MKHLGITILALATVLLASCGKPGTEADFSHTLSSPDGTLIASLGLTPDGQPCYKLDRSGAAVIKPSLLGFALVSDTDRAGGDDPVIKNARKGLRLSGKSNLCTGFSILGVSTDSLDETWQPVWGEESEIRNNYNELLVRLGREDGVKMNVRMRLYDDGLGFRYEFPQDNTLRYFNVSEELTEFALTGDHTAWWISGDYDTQEYNYTRSRLSEIGARSGATRLDNASATGFGDSGVQTALQLKTDDGLYINIHEAAVVNYPTANLLVDGSNYVLRTWLTPDAEGVKGRLQAPCVTPWRTVMVVDDARKVLASRLILNLNEPCAIEDVSWIHPVKYMGVWWEMITGRSEWSYTYDVPSVQLGVTDYKALKPHGRHGANNDNVRMYIDYAAANGFDALLIEGWNEGWEDWFGCQKDYVFDFVTPYPDFDLPALNKYAHEKGIRLVMHHETSSSTVNYERHMDAAYALMNQYGYDAVKSGYVGNIIPYGEHHYSQPLINHYLYALRKAADYHIMVNAHEAVRPTGLCRTWPNLIGNESAMGTEYRGHINPGHTSILPFTRLQGGPMDYTPGIFEPDMSITAPGQTGKMRHTICNQLGLYVTFYSPLQMAADLPQNYDRFPDAFQFIKDVAVDWEKSLYLEAEPGEYIVTARKPRISTLNAAAEGLRALPDGRKDMISGAAKFVYGLPDNATAKALAGAKPLDVWYVGGVCGEQEHETTVALDFLKPGVSYEATLYCDAPEADYETAPQAYSIKTYIVSNKGFIQVHMARGGGFALSLRELR